MYKHTPLSVDLYLKDVEHFFGTDWSANFMRAIYQQKLRISIFQFQLHKTLTKTFTKYMKKKAPSSCRYASIDQVYSIKYQMTTSVKSSWNITFETDSSLL